MSSKKLTCRGRVLAFLLAFATAMSSFPVTSVFAEDDDTGGTVSSSSSSSTSSDSTDSSITISLISGTGGTLKATLPDGTVYTSSENNEQSFEMDSGTKITITATPDEGYKVNTYQIDTADGENYTEDGKEDGSPISHGVTISSDAYVAAEYEQLEQGTTEDTSESQGTDSKEDTGNTGNTGNTDNTGNTGNTDNSLWEKIVTEGEKVTDPEELKDFQEGTGINSDDVYSLTFTDNDTTEGGISLYEMIDQGTGYTVYTVGPKGNEGLRGGMFLSYPTTGHGTYPCYVKTQSSLTGGRYRNAYCIRQDYPAPNGNTLNWTREEIDRKVLFVLLHGPMFSQERSVDPDYRVNYKDEALPYWEAEYAAAQYAIHILANDTHNGEVITLPMVRGWLSTTIYSEEHPTDYGNHVYKLCEKFVNAANREKYDNTNRYYYLTGDEYNNANKWFFCGWRKLTSDWSEDLKTKMGFYVSDYSGATPGDRKDLTTHSAWTAEKNGTVDGYSTNFWYPHYIGIKDNDDWKWYIDTLSFDTSELPEGAVVKRESTASTAGFKVWVPKTTYANMIEDTTYTLKVSGNVPGGLYAAKYVPAGGARLQDMTWLSAGGAWHDAQQSVKLLIKQQIKPGNIKLIKKSTNTDLTDGKEGYSLEGAEYGVYKTEDCSGEASYTMTVKKDSKGAYTATLDKVPARTWYVKETKAPKGYTLNSKVYPVDVPQNKTIEVPVEDNPITLTINLTKVSALPDCTNNNENYSLKGAVYTVYTDEKCKSPATKDGKNVTLTTDKNGKASVSGLPKGTYYVKETTASKGYSKDTTVHPVDGTNDKDASAGVISKTVSSSETPLMDPINVLIKKTDSKGDAPQPLTGAQFTVKYYSKIMTSDPGKAGEEPVRKWVFETKVPKGGKYAVVRYDKDFKISGPDLYTDVNGSYKLPFGTITVQETQAPNGYKIDNQIHVIKLDGKSIDGSVVTENGKEIPNNSVDFNIVKKQYGTESVISGAVFKHTDPKGRVETVTTDKNGKASFRGLIDGKHTIEETYVDPAYFLNDHKIEFTVTGGQISKEGLDKLQFEASGTNGSIKVTANKEDGYDAVIEDKPAYYKLQMHKVNDVDTKLAGAEFTLYSDAACTKVLKKGTTDSNGILTMEQLTIGQIYYLAETKAPNGYRLPLKNGKPVVYTIRGDSSSKDNFAIVVNDKSYSGSSGEWYVSGSGSDRYAHFRVVNQRQAKLPNTGSHAMIIIVIAGLALVVGALVFERKNKKKK